MEADAGADGSAPAGHRVPLNARPSTETVPDGGTSTATRDEGPSTADPGGSAASLTGLSRTNETLSYLPGATRAVPPSGVAATRDSSADGRLPGGAAASPMARTEPSRPTAYTVPRTEASMSTMPAIPIEPTSMSAPMSYARMPPDPAAYSMPPPREADRADGPSIESRSYRWRRAAAGPCAPPWPRAEGPAAYTDSVPFPYSTYSFSPAASSAAPAAGMPGTGAEAAPPPPGSRAAAASANSV